MTKSKSTSFAIIAGIFIIIILMGFLAYRTGSFSNPVSYKLTDISLIIDSESEEGDTRIISGHFNHDISADELLYFWPENIEVTMSVDGSTVYEFVNKNPDISSTPGSTIGRVNIGDFSSEKILIKLKNPLYDITHDNSVFDDFLEHFYVGEPQLIYEFMLRGNFIGIGAGLLMFFVGVLFIIYSFIYYYGRYDESTLNFAFGFLAMCAGCYETNGATDRLLPLIITNPVWCSYFKLFSEYLFIIAVILYLCNIAKGKTASVLQTILSMLSILLVIVALVLFVIGYHDIYATHIYTLPTLFGLLACSCVITVIDGIVHKSEQLRSIIIALAPVAFALLLMTAVKIVTGTIFQEPLYLSAIICIVIVTFSIVYDARAAERALVWMNRQIIKSKGELDRTLENLSVSKSQNSKLLEEKELLEAQNQVDIMTGLFNKVAMRQVVSRYLENNNTYGVALIFIDLDHFKSLNDTLGHAVGDQAIKDAAKTLSATFRRYDLVSRFGGDEFCVFLRSIRHDDLVNKLTQLIDALRASYTDGKATINITGSVGCVHVMSEYATYEELLSAADASVYEAKNSGRDRYILNEFFSTSTKPKEE